VSVLLHEANAVYGGSAGAINLPLFEDDCFMQPHDK